MKNRTSLGDLDSAQNVDAKDAHYKTGTRIKYRTRFYKKKKKKKKKKIICEFILDPV